ncbi:MAG: amidohydrolase [Gudongella sp.]|nr:amidohydrolase [Gudongella sp.]
MDKKNLDKVIALRRELHQNPEPSNQEVWTKNRLMEFLKENTGLEIVDRGNFFYAIYHAGDDRRNIAFRADFDAIPMDEGIELPHGSRNPGVSHKCGHDGHSASLAGFALEVDQKGAEENVFFIFQHAEETGDGGAEASVFIGENDIQEIFAYHNMSGMKMNSVNIIDGTTNFASRGMTIRMTGKQSHASQPEMGRNPAFAIARVIDGIPELVEPKKNRGEVLATVIQVKVGDRAFGISAGKGELLLTIRAEFEEELDRLQENLEGIAKDQADKEGIKVEFTYNDVFPVTSNNPESADKIREAARRKGFEVVEMEKGFRGSEDFGHYLKKTKGAICYIGNGLDYPAVHTHEYDFPDEIIETAVELFKELAGVQ